MIKVIKEVSKDELRDYLYKINVDDKNLYDEIHKDNSIGIFQFGAPVATRLLKEIFPENFEELVAINALARPGSINMAEPYLNGKNGSPSPYPKIMDEILGSTNNTILFQEQIMAIFNKIGGFTLEEADGIRGIMKRLSKIDKKPKDLENWENVVKKFVNGAIEKGMTSSQAKKIADDMIAFSSYSFNRCFSGDCKIDRDNKARWSPTIEEMYKTKNDYSWAKENGHSSLHSKYKTYGYGGAFSLFENNRLYLNEIIDIYYSGKQEVFEIATESGYKIEVSKNHSFPTKNNEKSINTDLKIGDEIYVNVENKLAKLDKIISIDSKGIKDTYDVEMKTPYHTLSVNGIVAKNSHAVSYTYVAVMTLYFSYYFKKYFYSAILDYEIDRDNNTVSVLNSVRKDGYNILPPDVNKSHANMFPIGKDILFGLSNIKFVGEKPIKKIIENRPYTDLFDFIIKTRSREVSSKVIKALISVGAFDNIIGMDRKKTLFIFEQFWDKKKSIKIESKLKTIWDLAVSHADGMPGLQATLQDYREYEKNFFGFVFFTSMFSKKALEAFNVMAKKKLIYLSFEEVNENTKKIPVGIDSIRTIIDRNENEMAFIEVEDVSNKKITIPVFASYWKYIKNDLEVGNTYLINVYRDDNDSILFGQRQWVSSEYKIRRMIREVK